MTEKKFMQVFKFGGASIKDANSVHNMLGILKRFPDYKIVVVVSAMGKSTNELEEIFHQHLEKKDFSELLQKFYEKHLTIITQLFKQCDEIIKKLNYQFEVLKENLLTSHQKSYNKGYDSVISQGEMLSSLIIEAFLQQEGLKAKKYDANNWIKTNSNFRNAAINWPLTEANITTGVQSAFKENNFIITQGFIGSDHENQITTLGREGSDFTAAIFASCLNTQSVTIWKDVPGILNADPKKIPDARLYKELSFGEAAEMTYYGASVIHPKTIKPLANKNIPLHVRSFQNPDHSGTIIHNCKVEHLRPCIIIKEKQCLITFQVTDFTFISEHNLSKIFTTLDQLGIKINMMQNSAISFSICVNDDWHQLSELINALENDFKILYNKNLELITIKNYEESLINDFKQEKTVYLEQRTRKNYQVVVK